MSKKHPKILMREAAERVSSASYCPKKLTAIHAGIAAGASLLVALLTYLLGIGIDDTAGLGGINSRAALETAQTVLQMVISILSPFWALGFVSAALHLSRGQMAAPNSLLAGFRRWGAALRLMLLEALIYCAVVFVTMQMGSYIYALTPASDELANLVNQMPALDMASLYELVYSLDQSALMRLFLSIVPFVFLPPLVAVILLSYRLRLSQFVLMDEPRVGALFAIAVSIRLTKKNCLRLLALDLRFWWFYLLEVLIQILCYGDLLLPMFGIQMGMNAVLASFLFFALAMACQVGLYVWQKPRFMTSFALFYDDLLPRQMPEQESAN